MNQPEHWALLGAQVSNPTLESVRRIVATSFDQDRFTQFATPVWVPPRSRRDVVQLIRVSEVSNDAKSLAITTTLIDPTGARESMIAPEAGLFPVDLRVPAMAVVGEDPHYDLVHTSAAGSGAVSTLAWANMPPLSQGYDSLDVLVLAQRGMQLSVPQREALRQWLLAGGTLWIMLDACDPDLGPSLVGADWPVLEVDRVRVTSVAVESERENESWRCSAPTTLVRVVAGDAQVLVRSGAWPIAVRRAVGRGQLVVTTLAAAAWMQNGKVVSSLDRVTGQFLRRATAAPLDAATLEPLVREQIGYQIMSREPVLAALVVFAALIVGSGLWLMRSGQLDKLAWLSPLLAGVTLMAVLGMGYLHRREVPRTLASLRVMEVSPGQDRATVTSMAGIYAASAGPLQTTGGSPPWPEQTTGVARTQRLLMTDIDQWTWQELDLPLAVRMASMNQVVRLPQRLSAELTINEQGVQGQWYGGTGALEDAVIASTAGALAPRWSGDAQFIATPDDRLLIGRFVTGNMTAIKGRRQTIYRELMLGGRAGFDVMQPPFPTQLSLMGWTSKLPGGLSVPQDDVVHRDETLVVVPLTIRRPASGTPITVPGPLIAYETVRSRSGSATSLVFDNNRRRWIGDMNSAQVVPLQFQLPQALLPLRLERVLVELEIRAPGRTVQLLDYKTESIVLAEAPSPDGVVRLQVSDLSAVAIDAQGAITLCISVTEPTNLDTTPTWDIRGLQLQVGGVVE
jgi:hypothetical protein